MSTRLLSSASVFSFLAFVVAGCGDVESTRVGAVVAASDEIAPEAFSFANGGCVRKADATVVCGVLDGSPEKVDGLTNVAGITDGPLWSTCARLVDGRVRCWFADTSGGPSPVHVWNDELRDVSQVTSNTVFVYGLTSDRRVLSWEAVSPMIARAELSTVFEAGAIDGALRLAAGNSHLCATTARGTVACRGSNDYGQLGDGTHEQRLEWRDVPGLSDVASLAASDGHTCAVRRDGTVACWGSDESGAVGLEGTSRCGDQPARQCVTSPQTIAGVTGAVEVVLGARQSCALLADRTVTCWGSDAGGPAARARIALAPVHQLYASANRVCAVVEGGDIDCWGLLDEGADPTLVPRRLDVSTRAE